MWDFTWNAGNFVAFFHAFCDISQLIPKSDTSIYMCQNLQMNIDFEAIRGNVFFMFPFNEYVIFLSVDQIRLFKNHFCVPLQSRKVIKTHFYNPIQFYYANQHLSIILIEA